MLSGAEPIRPLEIEQPVVFVYYYGLLQGQVRGTFMKVAHQSIVK